MSDCNIGEGGLLVPSVNVARIVVLKKPEALALEVRQAILVRKLYNCKCDVKWDGWVVVVETWS